MNARERQVKQVKLEMECEEFGHVFEMGELPCVRCGESYGEVGATPNFFEEMSRAMKGVGVSAQRAIQSQRQLYDGLYGAHTHSIGGHTHISAPAHTHMHGIPIVESPLVPDDQIIVAGKGTVYVGEGQSRHMLGRAIDFSVSGNAHAAIKGFTP